MPVKVIVTVTAFVVAGCVVVNEKLETLVKVCVVARAGTDASAKAATSAANVLRIKELLSLVAPCRCVLEL